MNRLLVAILALLLPASAAGQTFVIHNACIFDGERLIPRSDLTPVPLSRRGGDGRWEMGEGDRG